jgi:hypothetical protein
LAREKKKKSKKILEVEEKKKKKKKDFLRLGELFFFGGVLSSGSDNGSGSGSEIDPILIQSSTSVVIHSLIY